MALTRTRNQTFILTPDSQMSPFVRELIETQGVPYQAPRNADSLIHHPRCPKCKTGYLVLRTSGNRQFLGCTNFPTCDKTLKNTEILRKPIRCMHCNGYMVKRKGKYGEFYGCTNYPRCRHTVESL